MALEYSYFSFEELECFWYQKESKRRRHVSVGRLGRWALALGLVVDEERRSRILHVTRKPPTTTNKTTKPPQSHRVPSVPGQTNYKLGANFKLSSKLPGIARLISPRPRCLKYQFLFCFCPSISRRSLDDFI